MVNLALLQFILYNFLQNHIKWTTILSCWEPRTQYKLAEMLMDKSIYIQFWNINDLDLQADILVEERYLVHDQPYIGVVFDLNCLKSEEFLNKTSKEKLYTQHFHWLIYDDNSNLEKFRNIFENYNMAVDADVTYVLPNQSIINTDNNSTFITYDVYNNGYNLGGKLNMTADREIQCSWKNCELKQYLSALHEKTKYENRWSLKDITMRVSTVVTTMPLTEPTEKLLEYLASSKDRHIDGIARFGYTYFLVFQDTLQCKFVYNFTNGWSRTDATGGLIGALGFEASVDLASSPYLPSQARSLYAQLIVHLGEFRQVCIFRTPRNAGIRGDVYLEPFSSKVWLVFGCCVLLIACLLWFTFRIECYQLKSYLSFLPSLLTTCLISFGAACCQGSFMVPNSMGGRFTFISLSLLTFIMYNYYTSIVVAILLGSPVKSNIKTIGQLAESNLDVALEPRPYTKSYLFNISTQRGVQSFVRNKIKSRKNPDSIWLPLAEGIRRVRDEPGFVYGTDSFSGFDLIEQTYTASEICDLNQVVLRPPQPLYTHMHKNSSYKEFVKLKQYRILEAGIHQRIENIWVKINLPCYLSSASLVQVGLEYTAPLFIMLATVYMFVLILLVIEIFWKKYLEKCTLKRL